MCWSHNTRLIGFKPSNKASGSRKLTHHLFWVNTHTPPILSKYIITQKCTIIMILHNPSQPPRLSFEDKVASRCNIQLLTTNTRLWPLRMEGVHHEELPQHHQHYPIENQYPLHNFATEAQSRIVLIRVKNFLYEDDLVPQIPKCTTST